MVEGDKELAYSRQYVKTVTMCVNYWMVDMTNSFLVGIITSDRYGGTWPEYRYDGFEQLIKEKGYKVNRVYTPTYELIRLNIILNIPVFITSGDCCFGRFIETTPGEINYYGTHSTGMTNYHTFIAYGYREYKLYDKDDNLVTLNFLKVATGNNAYYDFFLITEDCIFSAAGIQVYKTTLSRC